MHKKLYRSRKHRVFAGVFGGLAEYFDVDPVAMRLLGLVILIFSGLFPMLFVYIFAIFIVPEAPEK